MATNSKLKVDLTKFSANPGGEEPCVPVMNNVRSGTRDYLMIF